MSKTDIKLCDEIIENFPLELRSEVSTFCMQEGHASGYAGVLYFLQELEHRLLPKIEEYGDRRYEQGREDERDICASNSDPDY